MAKYYAVMLNGHPCDGLPLYTWEANAIRAMDRAWRKLRKDVGPGRMRLEGHFMNIHTYEAAEHEDQAPADGIESQMYIDEGISGLRRLRRERAT